MSIFHRQFFLCLFAVSYLCPASLSADRLMMEAKIAGQTARLDLDTGAERLCLFNTGARRLGLKVKMPSPNIKSAPGKVAFGRTEECEVEIGPYNHRVRLPVVILPGYIEPGVDGVIGWDIISQLVVIIDALHKKVSMQDQLPPEVVGWSCGKIRPGVKRLVVEIPNGEHAPEAVMIDTGSPSGVMLAPERWRRWTKAKPHQPATLSASFWPGVGILVTEERWAPTFALGDIVFHEVPVSDYGALIHHAPDDRLAATLGLRAMRRFSWVIDAPNGKLYFTSHRPPVGPNTYEYNRLGAVFVPVDGRGDALVAHVVEGGPAHRAGVRDGDILLCIGDLDVTKWRTDPGVLPLSRFWSRPAKNALHLGLQRQEETINVTAILENIFPARFGT